jgi:DNA-binding GntR family transcriptional regulator
MTTRLAPITDQRSLQERTYQMMRSALLEGEYLPGDRIYEATIAQALGVSRNPVREAVRRLQQDGLVEVRPHYGIYVATIPAEEIEDVYRIRGALEATAAGLATERMSADQIDELETIYAEQVSAANRAAPLPREPVSVVQADRFHHAIHVGASSPRLLALLEQMYAQVTHFRNLTLRVPGRATVSAAGHRAILDAIRSRDVGAAEHQMRLHIDDARQALEHQLLEARIESSAEQE